MSKKSKVEKAEKKAAAEAARLAAEKAERKAAKKAGKKKAPKKGAVDFAAIREAAVADGVEPGTPPAVVVDMEGVEHVGTLPLGGGKKVKGSTKRSDGTFPEPGTPAAAVDAVAEQAISDAKVKAAELATMTDAELKARVKAKRAAREALEATAAEVDRDDEAAVAAYNAALAEVGGGHFLTSTAEKQRRAAELGEKVAAGAEVWAAPAHIAEVVATEEGDVIAVGPERPTLAVVESDDLAVPSEGGRPDFEVNGLGQYKIKRPSDGRIVGYTRMTTYIDNLEDKSALRRWEKRIMLEGAAIAEVEHDDHVLVTVRDVVHRREVAVAKARKADRKGKLKAGQLGDLIDAANRDAKKALDELAERMLETGGAHEKREKGTDLHGLCEVADLEGIGAVEAMVEAGTATPADLADVKAYLAACEKAGVKVLAVETVVVNDDLKVAGRLDRVLMYKPEGKARGMRVVGDVKTGRIDYGHGKIAQQIAGYAGCQAYDLETHERTPLGASKTLGLLIHLPAGQATCTIYEVDLALGAKGLKLSGEVRAWRNAGKKAIDEKKPIAAATFAEAADS